jgi:hypothetical protein
VRAGIAILVVVALTSHARAQPDPRQRESGYIGKDIAVLEIDDCPAIDPAISQDELRRRGSEHYERGETLYVQGDYEGAVHELVASYCLIPYYTILKDIGQAYERSLEYEKAIGYLERYVRAIPDTAKRASACAADPQEDKANVGRRIAVLSDLKAHVFVETTPGGAKITIGNQAGIAARATSGDQIEVLGGRYEMTVERDGYEPVTQELEAKIGKPYTFYFKLVPLTGRLSVLVTPPDARIFIDNRLVGFGRYDETIAGTSYTLLVEAPGYETVTRRVEVLPNQARRELIELPPRPQTGRRQLIGYAAIAGGVATGALLNASSNTGLAAAGTLAGATAGLAGGYFQIPDHLSLGTSNLTITASLTGGIMGAAGASLFTARSEVIQPVLGASMLIGAAVGYYAGEKFAVQPGEAALLNSAILWGTTTGSLLTLTFDPPRTVGAGLVLSGLGMGGVGGVLLTRYFKISRTHAVLIDIGGLVGIIGGLATESLVYPGAQQTGTDEQISRRTQEHLANFALGGMVVGLIGAGVLTRNIDDPKVGVTPTLGTVTGADGHTTTTYGILGSW